MISFPAFLSECGAAAALERDPVVPCEAAHAVQGVGARRLLPRRHPQGAQGPTCRYRVRPRQGGEKETEQNSLHYCQARSR